MRRGVRARARLAGFARGARTCALLAGFALAACGGGRDVALPTAGVTGVAADASPARGPCAAAAPLAACAAGFAIAWEDGARKTRDQAGLVTDARGVTSLVWTDAQGIAVARACAGEPGGAAEVLPASADGSFETAVASDALTVIVGVVKRAPHEADLVAWVDRGGGFERTTLSRLVRPHARARAAVGAGGRIGVAWFDGPATGVIRFAVIEPDGTVRTETVWDYRSYSFVDLAVVALPGGGWIVVEAGGTHDKTVVAHVVGGDGKPVPRTPPRPRLLEGEIRGFVAAWDGEAVAVALEHGDFGRDAGGSGNLGWGARPDAHEIRVLRLAPDGTPLHEPIILDRAADVGEPSALVSLDGHTWLAGGEHRPQQRRPLTPQLVRLDRTGAVTHRLPLGLRASSSHVTLHTHAGTLRGAVTDAGHALRTFTVRCAP